MSRAIENVLNKLLTFVFTKNTLHRPMLKYLKKK